MKRSKSQPQGNLLVNIPKLQKKMKLADYDSNGSVGNDAALEIKGVTFMSTARFIHRKHSTLKQSLKKQNKSSIPAPKLIQGRDFVRKAKTSFPIARAEPRKRAKHKCSMSIDLTITSRNKMIPLSLYKNCPKKPFNAHRRNRYLSNTVKQQNDKTLAYTPVSYTHLTLPTICSV
eukprot:TRINITY_DN26021_c0_g1_i2.p1 TRINITY_DN26021_c0_g1~~TRINITY_DN26021_c0_g1_i2.p1  ORF type:complete len:175 (-),score=7.94 TRINITY_DN26021_c0_g1_i2:39-563(-)